MSIVQYEDIKRFVDDGKTPEEILSLISPLTNGKIDCGELENYFHFSGLAVRDPVTGSWTGSLVDLMGQGDQLGDDLSLMFTHLNKPRSVTIDTDIAEWAVQMERMYSELISGGNISVEQKQAIIFMAGGYLYPDVVIDDVIQCIADEEQRVFDQEAADEEARQEAAARQAYDERKKRHDELYNTHLAPLQTDYDSDPNSWVAGLQAMSDEFIQPETTPEVDPQ